MLSCVDSQLLPDSSTTIDVALPQLRRAMCRSCYMKIQLTAHPNRWLVARQGKVHARQVQFQQKISWLCPADKIVFFHRQC